MNCLLLFMQLYFFVLLQNDYDQCRGVKAWKREKLSLLKHFMFGVINPHAKVVRGWTQLVITSCSFATVIDPLFCYLLSVNKVQPLSTHLNTDKYIWKPLASHLNFDILFVLFPNYDGELNVLVTVVVNWHNMYTFF